MKVLRGFAPDGSRAWGDDKNMQDAFWEDVKSTPAWSRYVRDYGTSDTNNAIIVAALETLYGETDEVSADKFLDALQTSMDSGAVKPKPAEIVEPAAAPVSVPTDKNGKPLTAAQVKWSKFIRWSETASASERKERARRDPAFAAFVQRQWQQEMTQPVDGDMRPFNPHLEAQAPPTKSALNNPEAVLFAERYLRMSADEVRAARSRAINPLTYQRFIDQVEEAIRLRLI